MTLLCAALVGCRTPPDTAPSSRQQVEADLVLNFQSWRSISFIKPDLTGTEIALSFRRKTFTRDAVVKLLNNLKIGREFVVVILDRQHSPDPMTTAGGIDEIERFLRDLGFRRVAFHDDSTFQQGKGMQILRDSAENRNSGNE